MEFLLFRPSCVMLSAHQDCAVCLTELYVYKNSKFNQFDLFPKQLNMVQYLLRGLRTITVGLKEGGQVVGSAHRQLSPCPAHSTCVCAHLCRLLLSLLLVSPQSAFWKCLEVSLACHGKMCVLLNENPQVAHEAGEGLLRDAPVGSTPSAPLQMPS